MNRERIKNLVMSIGLTLLILIGQIPFFIFAVPDAPEISNEDKAAVTESKTEPKAEKTSEKQSENETAYSTAKIKIKVGRDGSVAIRGKNGKLDILGENENIEKTLAVGDTFTVIARGQLPKITYTGVKEISSKKIAGGDTEYVIRILQESADLDIAFSKEFMPKARMMSRSAASASISVSTSYPLSFIWNGYCEENGFTDQWGKGIRTYKNEKGEPVYCINPMMTMKLGAKTKTNLLGYKGLSQADIDYMAAIDDYCMNKASGSFAERSVAAKFAIWERGKGHGYTGNLTITSGDPTTVFKIRDEAMSYAASSKGIGTGWLYTSALGAQPGASFSIKYPGYVKLMKSAKNSEHIVKECKNMYSLAGAEYTVYKDASLKDEAGKLITAEDGTTNTLELEAGSYWVKETKAPKGYALDKTVYPVTVTSGNTATIESKDEPLFDTISIVLEKIADGRSYLNAGDMSGAKFEISYYDDIFNNIEELKDKAAKRVWVLKTIKHPKLKQYDARLRDRYKVSGDEFFKNKNGEFVIPRGTMIIKELEAPRGYALDPKVYLFVIDSDSEDHSMVYNFGAIPKRPNKALTPEITTKAKDAKTGDRIAEYGKKIKLVDTVSYKGLWEDEEYTVKGILMDKETKKPLLVNGEEIRAEKTFTVTKDNSVITPEKGASGSIDLEYELDSTELAGKTTVVFEKLFHKDKEIATHSDITDEEQTVEFLEIGTTAKDGKDGDKLILPEKEAVLIDTVSYKRLKVGEEYTFTGTLMDKKTGKEILVDGKPVTAAKTMTAEKSDGTIDIEFRFNSKVVEGKTLVAFEKMTRESITYAVHADIEDADQTVKVNEPPKTGDMNKVMGGLLSASSAGLFAVLATLKKRKR